VEKVNKFDDIYPELGHVATVCVYPNFAKICHDTLENEDVEIACVGACFPSSQSFTEVKIAEVALALKDGATEIDIVQSVGKFLSGDYEGLCDEISEIKSVCGDKKLKVILETGSLGSASNIKKASILAMYAGADYIKTSTGKLEPAATPEAAYVMCQAIKEYYDETGIQIGFKPAGGMKTVKDVLTYYTIVKEILGEKWLTNEYFRLGTSSVANKLLSEILDKEIKFF
jgi:deoxyribose-phosphate aldolase